jgi:phosphatidylserine decarboxylase
MRIDHASLPFVLIAAAPALAAAALLGLASAAALALLPIAVALFFRDPDRTPPADERIVVSPADGRVMHAGPAEPDTAPPGAWQQVTVFLSLLDVHINRTPVGGRVTRIEYHPGTFKPAYRHDASRNERSEIWLDHAGEPIVVRQVVGVLARRVVCRLQTGQDVATGDRLGLMKFGSRMDVFLPLSADLCVAAGATVRGGESVIARLSDR